MFHRAPIILPMAGECLKQIAIFNRPNQTNYQHTSMNKLLRDNSCFSYGKTSCAILDLAKRTCGLAGLLVSKYVDIWDFLLRPSISILCLSKLLQEDIEIRDMSHVFLWGLFVHHWVRLWVRISSSQACTWGLTTRSLN